MSHDPTKTRSTDDRKAFDAVIRERAQRPFEWGYQDCCMFAADCVRALTGSDFAWRERGTYSTAVEAARLVRTLGGMEALGARVGPRIGVAFAKAGDVGLVEDATDGRELLAICVGTAWLAPGRDGLVAYPLEAVRMAWETKHG